MKTHHQDSIKIINIVGARPNFVKMASLYRAYARYKDIDTILVHTGQHYSEEMSSDFVRYLKLPRPKYNLGVGSASHTVQVAQIMMKLEKIFLKEKPDLVLVVGDVNSTLAAALAAKKIGISVAHVEAGLRSFDMSMPEEVNRILVDHVSKFLFVTEKSGLDNLKKEEISANKIFFVGNTIIDNLMYFLPKINKSPILKRLVIQPQKFITATLHRPSNVDSKEKIIKILTILKLIDRNLSIVFSIHPRTQKNIYRFGLSNKMKEIKNLRITPPLGYFDFIKLVKESRFILTDSGGIQTEAAYLKVPVLTLRDTTESLSTIKCGANKLVKLNKKDIAIGIKWALSLNRRKIKKIPRNDGKAANRIIKILNQKIKN